MKPWLPSALRWVARGAALCLFGLLAFFVIGEIASPRAGPPRLFQEWAGLVLIWVVALAAVAAWKRQVTGAVVSLAALILFWITTGLDQPAIMAILAMPGVLMLASGLTDWRMHRH